MSAILVVDDERDILDMVCDLLQDEGCDVICVNRPQDVVNLDESCHPAMFFVDLMLPEMSGITLARVLREDGFPDTPMIAMSASPSMLRSASDSHLFQGTLAKPFDVDQLLAFAERYNA